MENQSQRLPGLETKRKLPAMIDGFITSYNDIKQLKPTTLRGSLRGMALSGLAAGVSQSAFKRPRVHFIYIHHIFKDEEAPLRKLLDILKRDHEFISYTEAIKKIAEGKVDRPYITFSSDDGLQNNVKAAEILSEYGASCCFFINPGIIGVTDKTRLKQYCKDNLQFFPVDFMNWDEVSKIQKMGHEIGNHTMLHRNVAASGEQELQADLIESLDILRQRCGKIGHFAFPFGRFFHFSKTGRRLVFETGHTSCATAERGAHINASNPIAVQDLCIRRDHIVLGWPMSHILYFLASSAKKATEQNNFYPSELQ